MINLNELTIEEIKFLIISIGLLIFLITGFFAIKDNGKIIEIDFITGKIKND